MFEYCEHDLASLVDGVDSPFKESQVKTILKQLLSATMHLHKNFILHRYVNCWKCRTHIDMPIIIFQE